MGNMFEDDDDQKKVDEIAVEHGFQARQPKKRRNAIGASVSINVKLDMKTYERFNKYSEKFPGAGYRVIIQKLLDEAGY